MPGSIWLPGPEVCRKLQETCPDDARQHQNFPLFTLKTQSGVLWHNLANFPHVVQEANHFLRFCSVWDGFVWFVWPPWCNNHTIIRRRSISGTYNCRTYVSHLSTAHAFFLSGTTPSKVHRANEQTGTSQERMQDRWCRLKLYLVNTLYYNLLSLN